MCGPDPHKALATLVLIYLIAFPPSFLVFAELEYFGFQLPLALNLTLIACATYFWARATFCDPGTVPLPRQSIPLFEGGNF